MLICNHTSRSSNNVNTKDNIINKIKNCKKTSVYVKIAQNTLTNQSFIVVFSKFRIGENVLSNGNSELYALINANFDIKTNNIVSLAYVLDLIKLKDFPNCWWYDDELAFISNYYYGFDIYIFSKSTKIGYIFGLRPPIIFLFYVVSIKRRNPLVSRHSNNQ